MKRKNTEARQGYYLNRATGEVVYLDKIDALLAPKIGKEYIRVPAAAVFFGAPLIGLAYVVFLPFASLAGLVYFVALKVRNTVLAIGRHLPLKGTD